MSAKRAIGKIQSSQTMPASSMFELDTSTTNQFALPARMLQSTMWPRDAANTGRSAVRKDVGRADTTAKPAATAAVKKNKDDAPDEEENEFAFLPKTMGRLHLVTPVAAEGSVAAVESPVKKPEVVASSTRTKALQLGSSSEEDEVGVIMAGIRTSDDAINFFARFGSETPVKFVHLVHDPSPNSYSPYDLLVARGNADTVTAMGEYYTMSPAGIVHVCPGDPSACMPLSSWMRQGMMFKILRNIPFYKYFLHRKMFTTWRENVRYLFFAKQRRKLVDRMFYTRLSACDALFAVKKHLLEIQGVKLMNTDLKTSSKDDFIAMQTEFGTAANSKFEEVIGCVTREVERIMEEVNSSYTLSKQDQSTSSSVGYTEIGGGDKAKSLVKLKQEKAQKKIMRQKAKMEHATLTDYIRLVDYMVVQVLVALAVTMTSNFYEEIIRPRKAGVFETMVRFSTSGTAFSPTCMDIRDMLDRLLENMINFVGGVNRVRHLGSNKHLQLAGPNIQATVRENKRFRTVSALIQQRVVADFERAEEHAQSYESVRPIYDFNVTWDFAEYSSQAHDIASLKSMLELIGNWGKELEKLRNKPIGVLEVDSKRLKGELNPLKEARLQEIKDYVKDEARTRCVSLLEKYKDSITKLAYRPVFLKDYANQVAAITALRDQEKGMYKQTSQVDQMYNLLRQYEVKVPSEDLVLHEDLHERQQEYRAEIDAAQSYREVKQAEMIATVNVNIAKLQEQVVAIVSRLEDDLFVDTQLFNDPDRVLEELQLLGQRLETADQLSKNYCSYQRLFGVEESVQSELDSGKEQFETLKQLWEVVSSWASKSKFWSEAQFTDLQVEEVDKEVQTFFKDSFGFHKRLGNRVTETLKDRISEFKAMMPNIMDLGNPNMKARHFEKLFKLIHENFYPDMPFSLSFLLKGGIMDFKDAIQETSASASGEAQLEDSLEKIRRAWDKQKFSVLTHRDQKGLFVLGSLEDIFTLLEDNQVTLQTMLGSRYIRGIQDRVDEWEKKLAALSETLDEWLICQRTWMYLENIFGAEDIQKQLPAESQKFLVVDRGWKLIMNRTFNDPRCLSALTPLDSGATLLQTFIMNNEALESIQKSLEEYLETKRMAFPRFYFLSNDELLEIMSQTRDPHAVQPHMSKCFDAIKRIKFGEGRQGHDILGYLDPSGEYVPLSESVKAEGAVEAWLLAFEKGMRTALYDNCKKAYKQYPPDEQGSINRKDWLWSYPAQVVIAIDQVVWTYNTSEALIDMEGCDGREANPEAMEYFLSYSLRQIDAMVDLVRAPLDKQQRMLMGALLTIDVHARDVTRAMVAKQVSSLSDFEWTKQLRYYWEEKEDDVFAKQTNSSFRYGYEYLGNGPRLVITPLTDICYMTLTGALHMKLGGAPAGPAGTGKTETTKDLAKALAVYCVVFNCSDGLDYKIMGRFFSGLAQQGAWACFDEFNRIDIEVLSVIAQQILCIQQAIVKKAREFDFEGKMIPLNYAFGVFITMNPGYAGRTELPDNLKSLFRPVAMMVPDYRLIAEIMLFAEGFANALPLSNKMAQLYALSSEQLSKQSHYDFGMRAVKSVLVAAGQLKRKEPETNEDILLIRAMRDSNVPKFLEQDLPLFGGILSDLFPGIKVPFVDYGKLQLAIEKTLDTLNLQRSATFITKVIQVHETQLVRHGMMVVGESGSGKTTNVHVLSQALAALFEEKVVDKDGFYKVVDLLVLNPKSITAGELYGEFNLQTNEWKDGIVPKLVRDCVGCLNEGSENRKWIIFDGPVDAVWIENMNTVLDDNKTLCLANSERIKLPSTLHMLFEVQDLKVASPATVSRCGMVYMEQLHVGLLSVVKSWGSTTMKNLVGLKNAKAVVSFIEGNLEACIDFIRYECKEKVATSNNQLASCVCNLIAACLRGEAEPKAIAQDSELVQVLVVWCLAWTVGGNLVDSSRSHFAQFCSERFAAVVTGSKYSPLLADIYGHYVDLAAKEVKPWSSLMLTFKYDPNAPFFGILVPTADTTRYRYLLDKLMNDGHNVLFMAETGVGKSVVINSFLNEMVGVGKTVSYVMGYSAQTKPANLRDVLETKLEKKRKNLLGPPAGKRMFMFVDDLNMPALETYGAQPPNELLRQVLDQGGFYDVQKLFFKSVQDFICVSACAPPGGGRNEVSPRLLRHFSMVWLTNLSTDSMCRIFSSILLGYIDMFLPAHSELAEPLVSSSVTIYMRIQKELLPTPLRSHYTFNLRDLSKVFQGVLMVKPKHHSSSDGRSSLLRLWCHESARVFRDRLINEEDREWFNGAVLQELHTQLHAEAWTLDDFADCLYGDFLTRTDKEYQELRSRSKVNDLLTEYLEEYNITFSSRMELVFFRDAVNHVTRIARVLSQPRGNALLVGVGGSGRQSLTRMASFMADFKCRQIEITRGYGINEFHENLKEILMSAGCKNLNTVFLFSDTQIVTETFLEDINNILNSGEVPNLYASDELEKIVSMVRPLAKAAGKVETKEAILQHYIHLVRENLHIVLCMSPIGAGFRTRCRMFPSLVNCCTIDWFNAWPEDALFSVAQRMFDSQSQLGIGDYVDALSNMCNKMHRTVEIETANYFTELKRYNYTTPTSYLELVKLYVEVLKNQQQQISANERRYRVGLDKLRETEEIVAKLEVKLTEMQPVLEKAAVDTAKLLTQVTADQADADKQAATVEVDVSEANKVAASVKVIKDDCQADLDEAMPAYESAVKALATLDKKSVQEMKAFNNPPEMVKFTLEAVCILMDVKPDWGEAKKLMSQMDFMDALKNYDKDNIPPKTIKKVDKYFKDPRFLPDEIKKQSSAAMCLCMWVRAMVVYDKVAKGIEPKKAALKEAEDSLAVTMNELANKKAALQAVLDRVALLQKTLRETQQKKADLEEQAATAKKQMERAGLLLGGLGGEKVRWQESAANLNKSLLNLVGDMCLAAGCLAYLGPFTSQFRIKIVNKWLAVCRELDIPCSEFTLLRALAVPVVLRGWQIDGLPADDFSCENGLLTTMGRRWPLMIDPQGQANRWVRNMYASKNLQIIKLTEKDFLRTLENGIRYGAPVLLENVGQELDPSLEPVLLKQVFKRAGQLLLRLGDTDVPYSDEFKFMITTKLANPHYMPEVCIKVTVINFTVTMRGLEDQLLVDVIKNERPDLELRRDALVVSIANDQRQLLQIEEQILSMLAAASGNILDDEELINALARSKKTSSAINVRLSEAETTTQEINDTREGYRVVATRGSVIYFVVAALALVDPMYQYSLQYYKELFVQRLQKTDKKEVLQERLELLIDDITRSIYTNVCRGLFEKDKLLYSFTIAVNIDLSSGAVSAQEWQMFLVGSVPDISVIKDSPLPESLQLLGVAEKTWFSAVMLEHELGAVFQGLCSDIRTKASSWVDIFNTESPHSDTLPGGWELKLSSFQRLLLIRYLREEKVVFAIRRYVDSSIGAYFTESPPFDLEGAFADSVATTPLIFILSPGADPTDYLLQLAQSKGKDGGQGLRIISLGQGQGPIAERAIEMAQRSGDWVCLQNCHLAVSWLAKLELTVERMQNDPESVHLDFRIWLTSMPSAHFPVPVLQNGIKVTNEPPRGLRANLMRTFGDVTSEEYESCSKPEVFKKLLFATAFFNALILERRKFGAVGWNIPYDWMNSDLKAAMTQVRMYVEEQAHTPWETLNVSVSDITYGGRVTDVWDKRSISSILRKYFQPQLTQPDYYFTENKLYYAPPISSIHEVRDYIRHLPVEDIPDVFGLHSNAAITFQQKESRNMIATIVLCAGSGGGGGGGGGDSDARVRDIAAKISDRMPGLFDMRKAHPETFKKVGDAITSLGVFLSQELMRFNVLVEVMVASLHQLQRAIKGEVVMSGELENMYSCFVFQKVPPAWESAGYPCLKPLPSWVEDFLARMDFMGRWLLQGPRVAYWLPGFFFPQGFMTAVKQTYSRDFKIAVDTLRIGCEMTALDQRDIEEPPVVGAYVFGLFMEGGRFNRNAMQIDDSLPRVLLDAMPCIWLKPVITADYNPVSVYDCPLYKTSIRAGTLSTTGHSTNFVVALPIPTVVSQDHWIRRGCAMLCMKDE